MSRIPEKVHREPVAGKVLRFFTFLLRDRGDYIELGVLKIRTPGSVFDAGDLGLGWATMSSAAETANGALGSKVDHYLVCEVSA